MDDNDLIRRGDAKRAVWENDGTAILGAIAALPAVTPSPDPAALVKAAVTPPLDRTDESVRWYSGEATASELLAVAERRAAAIRSVSPDPAALADLDAKGDK
jgi:hypothetical protein